MDQSNLVNKYFKRKSGGYPCRVVAQKEDRVKIYDDKKKRAWWTTNLLFLSEWKSAKSYNVKGIKCKTKTRPRPLPTGYIIPTQPYREPIQDIRVSQT